MTRVRTPFLLALLGLLGACAEAEVPIESDAQIMGEADVPSVGDDVVPEPIDLPEADTFTPPVDDVPPVEIDAGTEPAPDVPASFDDVVSPRRDVVISRPDVVSPRPDVVVSTDAGTLCVPPQTSCAGRCVSTATDPAHCGACGNACGATAPMCMSGRCGTPGCGRGASDCDGNMANGCERSHLGTATCAAAVDLGAWCGDTSCGFLCPATRSRVVATRQGTASAWFRGRAVDCSLCVSRVEVVFELSVPAGIDYDLFVYDACGGRLRGSSLANAGQSERVQTSEGGDLFNGSDFGWFVEVRYVSGAACGAWTLNVSARANSATGC